MEEAANLISSPQLTLTEIDTVVANVNERGKRTILHIETAAQRLMQTIAEHRHKLVSKVSEITEAKLQALQAEKESVQDHFRAVENVLRCAQNTGAVEDSEEWENALSRHLSNLRGQVFDFQEYDEDLKFHFLYQDENLLAAICKFGDVFTIANDGGPREAVDHGTAVVSPEPKTALIGDNVEDIELSNNIVFTDTVECPPLLMEVEENFCDSKQRTTETKFVGEVTRVFEETVDVTRLEEKKKNSKDFGKATSVKSQGQIDERVRVSNEGEDAIQRETSQDDFISSSVEVPDAKEVFSDVILKGTSAAIEGEKDQSSNELNNDDNSSLEGNRLEFSCPDSTEESEIFSPVDEGTSAATDEGWFKADMNNDNNNNENKNCNEQNQNGVNSIL